MDYEETFNMSFWRALGTEVQGISFAETAYQHFLTYPEVEEEFRGRDPEKPKEMLRISITLASSYYFTGSPDHLLRRFAEMHSQRDLDIKPHLYDYWLESVLVGVRAHDPECNDEVLEAWSHVLQPAIEFMRDHYEK